MKKTMRKLIPAAIMLLIAAMLVGTSTYAWFSMNSKVTVTGMTVTAKVSDNILIAEHNTEGSYSGGINQTRSARLAPVSTIDGVNFYYANSQTQVLGSGASKGAANGKSFTQYSEGTAWTGEDETNDAAKTGYDNAFQAQAGVIGAINKNNVAYGYLDYVFYIKATNADTSNDVNLNMTVCNLLYNGSALTGTDKAWRIAVFVDNTVTGNNTDVNTLGTLKTILAPASAVYFETNKAADDETNLNTVNLLSTSATLETVGAGLTVYRKVTVRLWMEGEDQSCKNENYTTLTDKWSLDLAFAFYDNTSATAGASAIQSTAITASGSGNTATITLTEGKLSNGETPASYAWKTAAGADATADAGSDENPATYQASSTGDYYCLITTTDGNVYRTANISLTVTP